MQAIKRECGCVHVCLSPLTQSPVDSYLCVYVMESLPNELTRGAPQDVSSVGIEIKRSHRRVYICVPVILTLN